MADGPEDNLFEDCLEALASLKGSFSSSTSYRSPAYPKSSDESAPPPKRQSSEAKKDTSQDTKIIVPTLTNPNHDDSTRSDRSFESHEVVFNTTGYTKPKLTNKPKSKQRPRSKSKPIDVPQSEYAIPSLMTILMSGSACSTSAPSSSSFLGDISLLRKTSLPPDFRDDAAANPTKTATKTALIAPTSSINPPPSATNPSSSSSTGTHQRDRKRRYEWLSPYAYVKDPDARARIAELEGRLVEETQRRKVIEEEIRSKQSQNDLLSPTSLQNQLPQQQQQTQGTQSQQQGFPLQIKPGQEFIPLAIWPRRISEQNPSEAGRIQLPVAAEAAAEAAAAAAVAAAATGTTVKAQNDASGGGDAGQKKKRQYRRYNKKMFNSITDTDSVIQNTFVQKKQQEVIHQILQSKAGVNAATAGLIPGVKTSTNPIQQQQQQQQQQPPSNLMYDKDGDAIMAAASMTVPTKMNAVPSFGNSGSSVPASFMFPEPQQQQHQHQQQQQGSPTTLLLPQIKKE